MSLNTSQPLYLQDLSLAANLSLFTQWRPTYHFQAPNSWMNDPCAPVYDPATQLYHLHYQWHPQHIDWGNISYGHATSKNLVQWQDVPLYAGYQPISLGTGPLGSPDHLGVFTGSQQPISSNGQQNGSLTILYTSVKHLPTSYSAHYIPGTETQSLATSNDGGLTWHKYSANPVISGPPATHNVTGFRDPFYFTSTHLDQLMNTSTHWYTTISSGNKSSVNNETGGRLSLYRAPQHDLTNWTFVGTYHSHPGNYTTNTEWSGSSGYNWEVANVFDLVELTEHGGDNQTVHYFFTSGTEGGNTTLHTSSHWSIWEAGNVTLQNGVPTFTTVAGGVSDAGDTYALNSFDDPTGRRIYYGWVPEALVGTVPLKAMGYAGQITLPREAYVLVRHDVVDLDGSLQQSGPWMVTRQSNGLYTYKTLAFRPVAETALLWQNATTRTLTSGRLINTTTLVTDAGSKHYALNASFQADVRSNAVFGINFGVDTATRREYTTLFYNISSQTVTLDRTHSSLLPQYFLNTTVYGKFAPLTQRINGVNQTEAINVRLFVDNSLVEIFINDRFSLATHIYPTLSTSTGVELFSTGAAGTTVNNVTIATNLAAAFPQRPENSSISLLYDSANVTSNGKYWTGY